MGHPRRTKGKKGEELTRLRKSDLARELGISRVTLDRYLNMDAAPAPDRKLTFSIEETASFIAKQKIEEGKVKGVSYWTAEKARLQCEQLAEEMARARGEYIAKAEAGKTLTPLMRELGDMMRQKFEQELPARYKGHDMIECAQMNAAACDAIAKRFRDGAKVFLS